MLDDFNDLAAFDSKTTFARLGYTVSSPNGLTAANVAPFLGSRSLVLFSGNALQPVTFSFDSPVSAFGLFIGDAAEGSNSTLSFTNNLGHNFTIASGPLPDNSVLFFGVVDLQNPFTSLTIQGNAPSDGFAMDDVYITTAVPEPTSVVLFGIGAVALGACTIRGRRRQRVDDRNRISLSSRRQGTRPGSVLAACDDVADVVLAARRSGQFFVRRAKSPHALLEGRSRDCNLINRLGSMMDCLRPLGYSDRHVRRHAHPAANRGQRPVRG
jgi:hypothetical protein